MTARWPRHACGRGPWALGFELSRIATIYPQPHDIAMDHIITGRVVA